ncbi:MAG: MFS transporter [Acidobacteriota bacterium]
MTHHDSPRSFWTLFLGTLAFALCFTVWGLVSPLAPVVRERYALSATQVGLLVATPVLLGAVLRIPAGMLADRYGGRVVFPGLLLLLVPTVLVAGLSQSFAALLAAAFLMGTSGASFAVGIPYVAQWFSPRRQGLVLGIYGAGNIGTAAAALVAPRVAASAGWAWAFWMWVPLLVAVAAAVYLTGRDSPAFAPRADRLMTRLRLLVDRPVSWVLILFYFVTFGGFVAMGAFLPALLVSEYHLSAGDAGARTAGFVIMATLARPLGGWLADRWGGTFVLAVVFVTEAAFAVLLAFEPGMVGLTIGFLGSAFALGVGNGAVFKLVAELFPAETGTVAGLVGAAGGLGGFFPPLVLGFVHDATGSYAIGFMLLSEFALACLIVNLLVLQGHAEWFVPEVKTG